MMTSGGKGDNGKDGADGKDGTDGHTPERGVDYWTESDIAAIHTYINRQIGDLGAIIDEINGEVL